MRELVVRAQNDDAAFSELVEATYAVAFDTAYAVLGDAHLAEDAVQEAFIQAWRYLGRLREPDAFRAWLRRIVVNQCHRRLRALRPQTVELAAASGIRADTPNPHAVAEMREMRERVLRAIDRLPRAERQSAMLYHLGDHTYGQIAAYMRVPVTTVEHRLRTARTRLRTIIAAEPARRAPAVNTAADGRPAMDANMKLIDAIKRGEAERAQKLIEQGADIHAITSTHPDADASWGFFPVLKAAILYGQPQCARLLIERGAPTRHHNWDGLRDAEALEQEDIAEMIRARREREDRLILTIVYGHVSLAAEMLDEDPTLSRANEGWHGRDRTPLMYATEQGYAQLVQMLIESGADVHAETEASSVNALTHAIYEGHDHIARLLRARGAESDDVTNTLFAARKGNTRQVLYYLDVRGVDVNAKDSCKRHILSEAFVSGNDELVDFVFARGADPNQSHGWEDFCWLLEHIKTGDIDTVRKMLEHGYDPNSGSGSSTLLSMARERDQKEIEAFLIESGATV